MILLSDKESTQQPNTVSSLIPRKTIEERMAQAATCSKNPFVPPKEEMTALQKHAAFFDLNGDGLVTPMETFRACRKLGFNLFLCLLAPLLINLPFAWWTSPSWWPTLTFRIGNIHRCRHGSDSQIYDQDGNFHEDRFEQFWQRFDKDGD